MENVQKAKNKLDQLKQVYKTWQQFMSKSKIKMRKKVKKDKKQYYDFDYTRGQYYYNYPEYHINFATPEVQMAFFKDFLQQQTKPISDVYHSELLRGNQIQSILKPQQYHDFLIDVRNKFQRLITTLRIQKSLYIQQNAAKPEVIDFMQDQIRSFNSRLVRFHNVYFTFQKSLSQRLQDRTTALKLKKFDQMHFADIQKGDFVVFLRMEGVQQRLSFQLNKLKNQLQFSIMAKKSDIMKRCYEKRGINIKKIQKIHAQTYIQRKSKIEKYFIENDPIFFDAEQNLKILQKYLQSLNYTKKMNKFRAFFDVNYSLKQLDYIPSNQSELKQILYSVCHNYFPNQMVQNLYTHKKQHLCYRLNYFASIILRTISQSYNFIIEIKDKDLHGLRTTMKRQLETIFTNQADKLFNILEHQIICLVDQQSYQSPHFVKVASSENQNIFKQYFKVNKLVDPFTLSIINLLSTSSDKTLKQVVASYVSWVQQIIPYKLKYLSLYYKNFHSDYKSHIVNLLNSKLIINAFSDNVLEYKFQKILNPNPKIDENLTRITYLLYAINNIQTKKQLDSIINAQIAIMYKVKYKLSLLEYKHQMPFQMAPQFLTRFTQSNYSHDFISETELKNPIPYPQIENHDKVCRVKNGSNRQRVQVRRVIPKNPLFEGKKILYSTAVKQCNQILEKLNNMCAYLIEQRQNYLHQEKLSGIVDRFQLVNNVLKLEIQHQDKKLLYMEELLGVYQHTIDPDGIFLIAEELYKVKSQQVYFNLNQTHYQEHYKNQTELWNFKANLLAKLRVKQKNAEDDQKAKFRQNLMKSNHVNNLPEISSIYYSDELAMEAEDNIVEQAQEESLSQVISQSQFVMNSSKYKSDISAISSQYHVKTTFKQILGRNSVNTQAIEQNRRQQLMGRKKKKILNDSVLGGLLQYDNQSKYYRFIHITVYFMKELEQMFSKTYQTLDPGIRRQYFQQINSLIDALDPNSIKQINLIDQNMLNRILSDCNRAISKLVEKYKVSPSALDEYLFFNSQIFKSLIQNSNFANLNGLRGLYTCLNIIKLYKAYPQYLQDKLLQNNAVKQFAVIAKKYSSQSLSKDKKFSFTEALLQKYDINILMKLIDTSNACLSNKSLIFLSNNSTLSNTLFALNHSVACYYKALLISHYEQIFDYRFFLTNLELLEAFGVYCDDKILTVNGIQNRLFVRRKAQSALQRLSRLFKLKNIQQSLCLPSNCILLQKKQQKKTILNQMHILQNIQSYEDFTAQLAASSVLINSAAQKIRLKLSQKILHQKLQTLARILPYANTYINIISISAVIYKQMFQDNYKQSGLPANYQSNRQQQRVSIFQFKKLTLQNLTKNYYRDSITELKSFCKSLFERKYKQFQMSQSALQRYYDCMEIKHLQQPYRLSTQVKLKDIFDYQTDINKKINIITWIQCKLLLFGAQLIPLQLLYFRSMLQNISVCSEVFFRDESSRLINYHDIVKMKIESLDSNGITQKYINAFLNYENLKTKYKSFLDGLGQLDINNEGKEIINIIYIGNKKVFNHCNQNIPDFLSNYCLIRKIKNQTNNFIQFATKKNPNRYLKHSNAQKLTFSLLKAFMWDIQSQQKFKSDVFLLEQRCELIKQTLNSNNTKMKDMTTELSLQLYTRERMRQLHSFLQISITKKSRIEYAFFLKKLQQKLLLGLDKLSPIQKYLSKFIQKILKQKPDLVNLKDEIIQTIYESRFYEDLILSKLNSMSIQTLNKQLKLYQILFENYHQKQLIRQNKIIKNTLNKVLVPKIIINPYLQSPLVLENYFFAAALKLSYIDSFLNKLKNRAILVQLAEGGFGFLLKISELDQCIQSLCKGIITFTQKQFYDRFRTFLESYNQLKQKYKKSLATNQTLKNMIDICRQEWGKQIKSVIYGKLNSYIGTIHSKQKSYQSIFNIIKGLQLQIAKKIDFQYQQKIKQLQEQNIRLKEQFIQYQKITAKNARTSMQQSKDTLYNIFKKDVQGILNKQIIKDFKQIGEKQHKQQEQYMSTILLKRLRKQKAFYEMKISNMESKIRERANEIIKLKQQLTTIQNTLTSDQFKNAKLSQQIRHLLQKNIEIQDLKRQIQKRQEQQTLNKLKLIKINEHLQGRVIRLQQNFKLQSSAVTKETKKDQKDMGIQAVFLTQKRQRRNFKIKTQYSQQHSQQPIKNQNKVDQVPIWRQKWQNSQRKYHVLMSKIVQSYEVYKMNKNCLKLADKIGQIFEQCINNHILKKK